MKDHIRKGWIHIAALHDSDDYKAQHEADFPAAVRALIRAAAALHNAHNALGLCGYLLPTEPPAPGSGLTDMTAATILDPVLIDIREALDAIAAEIGEKAMLEASA